MTKTYIALLRGINVSGQKKIKMAELREHLGELGYEGLQTYIQSGNIVFQTEEQPEASLADAIQQKIKSVYGWEVPTLVMTSEAIEQAIQDYPWHEKDDREPMRTYFTFLADLPDPDRVAALDPDAYPPEEFVLSEKVIYFFSPKGYGRAKMNNNFFESKLKVKATTRNWKTTHKLLDMAKSLEG